MACGNSSKRCRRRCEGTMGITASPGIPVGSHATTGPLRQPGAAGCVVALNGQGSRGSVSSAFLLATLCLCLTCPRGHPRQRTCVLEEPGAVVPHARICGGPGCVSAQGYPRNFLCKLLFSQRFPGLSGGFDAIAKSAFTSYARSAATAGIQRQVLVSGFREAECQRGTR